MFALSTVLIEVLDASTSSNVFTFGDGGWKIYGEIDGLGNITPTISTIGSVSSYGVNLTNVSIGARIINFNVVNTITKDKNVIRDSITSALRPGIEEYILRITYNNKTRELRKVYLSDYKIAAGNINDFVSASFSFMATDPLFYDTGYKELFFNGSVYTGSVKNLGSAPALPIIRVSGAINDDMTITLNDKYSIYYKAFKGESKTLLSYDLENMEFSDIQSLSSSTEISRVFLLPGALNITCSQSNLSISVKFRERSFGL